MTTILRLAIFLAAGIISEATLFKKRVLEEKSLKLGDAIKTINTVSEADFQKVLDSISDCRKMVYVEDMTAELYAIGKLFIKLRTIDWDQPDAWCLIEYEEKELLRETLKLMQKLPVGGDVPSVDACIMDLQSRDYNSGFSNLKEALMAAFNDLSQCEQALFTNSLSYLNINAIDFNSAPEVILALSNLASELTRVAELAVFTWNGLDLDPDDYTSGDYNKAIVDAASDVPSKFQEIMQVDFDDVDFGDDCSKDAGSSESGEVGTSGSSNTGSSDSGDTGSTAPKRKTLPNAIQKMQKSRMLAVKAVHNTNLRQRITNAEKRISSLFRKYK